MCCLAPSTVCSIVGFYTQPKAARRATYAYWWTVVKKEAKHYWVRGAGAGWRAVREKGGRHGGCKESADCVNGVRCPQPPPACVRACVRVCVQVGIKLLAADVSIARRLAGKVAHGKTLTRQGGHCACLFYWSQSCGCNPECA